MNRLDPLIAASCTVRIKVKKDIVSMKGEMKEVQAMDCYCFQNERHFSIASTPNPPDPQTNHHLNYSLPPASTPSLFLGMSGGGSFFFFLIVVCCGCCDSCCCGCCDCGCCG